MSSFDTHALVFIAGIACTLLFLRYGTRVLGNL